MRSRVLRREQPQHADRDAVQLVGCRDDVGHVLPPGQGDLEGRQRPQEGAVRVDEHERDGPGHGGSLGRRPHGRRTAQSAIRWSARQRATRAMSASGIGWSNGKRSVPCPDRYGASAASRSASPSGPG